jgi:hypothetical protein
LAQARRWQTWLNDAPERSRADVARREGPSRAQVSLVLKLLERDPSILADLDRRGRAEPVPREFMLTRTAALPSKAAQQRRCAAVCVPSAPVSGGAFRRDDPRARPVPRKEAFAHALERARR